ncbi:hypothetical protein [Breznakia pachnodae]|jgi:hypothetical protein|uniref:Uncharacterized protein n=1 Tax=Breznakia pachnodae TaxID=265178 RepID=A0ABU0E5I0_9FIRM|nr:hypothetical protein [Breznakia pachnodae]MDQ0362143.1 hypothetical protein [Breznakia pachnodae]
MDVIYNQFGIEILKENDSYFIRYDSGEIASKIIKIEITEEEAKEIQQQMTDQAMYNYLIRNLNDRMGF